MNNLFVLMHLHSLRRLPARRAYLWSFFLALFVFSPALLAQGFGGIQGTVVDSSGAVIPGANVIATQTDINRVVSVSTNGNGFFVFPKLLPAQYSLSVKASGFENVIQNDVLLQADQSLTVNFTLHIGATEHVSRSISVQQSTLSLWYQMRKQVNLTNGTLSQVIGEERVNDLPLNGRNAAQLTTLVAGAVVGPTDGSDQGVTKSFPAVVNVSVNGSRCLIR